MKVLVCGGAGYIGAHMCKLLAAQGHEPVVFDNLSTGHREFVRWGPLEIGDLLDPVRLDEVFTRHRFDLVIHFAGLIAAGESVEKPELYYRNNVTGSLNLLDAMQRHGADRIVFSSSAAVYGTPARQPIREEDAIAPINPYGQNKADIEVRLREYAGSRGLNSVSLRYFNAAGADAAGEIGEWHEPETHLIPNILNAALKGSGQAVKVFGTDYPTPDGSCVRDYIHIEDLCSAHLAAARHLEQHRGALAFNLGNGAGFSVLEVLRAAEDVTGTRIAYEIAPRRPGDPPMLVADASRARQELGWQPRYTEIARILETAWRWHQRNQH